MAIQYKRIIKQIMGPDAAERGFVAGKLAPAGLMKRHLASYEKEYDDNLSLGFDIELDTVFSELELQSCGLSETRKFDKDDEDSFRSVINEFAQIMRDKGYALLDEEAAKPMFTREDQRYVRNNYKQLSEQLYAERSIDPELSFLDKLYLIDEMIVSCRGKSYEEVKEELIRIAAFFTTTLLECEEAEQYYTNDYSVLINGEMGAVNVMDDIMGWWLNERNVNYVEITCRLILDPDKINTIDWKK